jgi:release factor glutamine methyltransferase
MASVIELLTKGADFLYAHNVEQPRCDVEWLLAHILECSRLELNLNGPVMVAEKSETQFWELLARRAKREPLQYILGEVDFCDIKLKVDSRVFIPRGETETLVEWLVNAINKGIGSADYNSNNTFSDGKEFLSLNILDLGTGSGAIAIALAKRFPMSCVWAIDQSSLALEVAHNNMQRNGVSNLKLLKSNWYGAFEANKWQEPFDIIISNPPYLTRQEFDMAQDEVRQYEPVVALVAEEEGLRDIRIILDGAPKFLKKDGIVAIETGISHPKQLQKEYEKRFRRMEILQDLNQFDRFFIAYQ